MDAEALYGLPLERFVSERSALAKELRGRGEREPAEAVAKLRKPSLAAWAVNQLMRTQSRAATELFEAGDAAQHAQSKLLAGRGDRQALRAALSRERQAADQLVEVAKGLLSSEGHELSASTLERVSDILHAAALEPESRARVKAGCLDRELRHVGLSISPAPAAPSPRKPRPDLRALRKAETSARRAAERTARDLDVAQGRRDTAARELDDAERALAAAAEHAQEAQATYEQAQRELRRSPRA